MRRPNASREHQHVDIEAELAEAPRNVSIAVYQPAITKHAATAK